MEAGQIGYEAYAKSTGGKTYDGRDMPTWEQVKERTPHVAKAWNDAGAELIGHHVGPLGTQEEWDALRRNADAPESFDDKPPAGWVPPWRHPGFAGLGLPPPPGVECVHHENLRLRRLLTAVYDPSADAGHPADEIEARRKAAAALEANGWLSPTQAAELRRGALDAQEPLRRDAKFGFGTALHLLKSGQRVARAGWNGKGMWVALTPGSVIHRNQARAGTARLAADAQPGDYLTILPHVDMKAADGSLVIGWLASQTDMLAEDWMVVG